MWLEYLQISIGNMSSDEEATKKIRDLAERALMAVGLHVAKGVFIWEAYREFEQVLLAMVSHNVFLIIIIYAKPCKGSFI